MRKPVALFSGREVASTLGVTQHRFALAVKRREIVPDYIGNAIDLFRLESVRRLESRKDELFPPPNELFSSQSRR
jgi:hypothetical protein